MKYDVAVIGGGIIGLSTAWQLQQRYPSKKILLIEKENGLAQHQTGRNSGVIHSGIYYQPGSLKAKFCKQGLIATIKFCRDHGIRFHQCGKLLVATNQAEDIRMQALYERCRQNAIDCELLGREQLREIEPQITGTGAIHVSATGIVDYRDICTSLASEFRKLGGQVALNKTVSLIRENDNGVTLQTSQEDIRADFLVCCAGLHADRLARLHGLAVNFRIVPFRGEYYRLSDRLSGVVSRLIYPIPDPELPFLGIHLTKTMNGDITVGPNAVLGWKREGYGRFNFSIRDTAEMVRFKGFWKLVRSNIGNGVSEFRNSIWKPAYLRQIRKYCAKVEINDLLPCPAGVRAQAVLADGSLVQDFLFIESAKSLHVANAPSPAATSAFPIGRYICDRIAAKLA